VGTLGEYAAWWLHHFDDDSVAVERCANNSGAPRTLRGQVNAWANELFPGAEVNAQPVPKTSLMRLELRTGRQEDWRRPTNIGYGLSYAFPALLAGLLAKRGQILIIDSPEAHLHPQGQSRMGGFLAQIAAAGPQVILETHSDHVLNGIRVAVRDKAINADQVSIQFFNPRDGERKGIPQVVAVSVDEKGNLSHWPEGFFDQSEKDLASLAGWV
jgi:predicted ATPase